MGDRIAQQKLTKSFGANPGNQANGYLHDLVKEGRVVKVSPGIFALPDIAEQLLQNSDEELDAHTDDPARLMVNAYGLYWKRDLVDWEASGPGRLWGKGGGERVDFAGQVGIYLLHSGNEVVYVGQSRTVQSTTGLYNRLKDHHTNFRRTDRWDTFSWFGFRPVNSDTGELGLAPESAGMGDVIDVLEAIFIEGLMPRLNMRSGEGTREWLEANQYFQEEDPKVIQRRFAALAQVSLALQ